MAFAMTDGNRVSVGRGDRRRTPVDEVSRPAAAFATKLAVAVVDDDAMVRHAMCTLVRSLGYRARAHTGGSDLLAADLSHIGLVVSDLQMPEMNGLELHARLQDNVGTIPFVLMTAFPAEALRRRALAAGVDAVIDKPCDVDALATLIEELVGPSEAPL